MQDSSPKKDAVFKEALARYEASLQNEKEHDGVFFRQYHERLERQADESKLAKERKLQQQLEYKEAILKQAAHKVS